MSVGGLSWSRVSSRSPLASPASTESGRCGSAEKPVSVVVAGRSVSEVSMLFSAPKCKSDTITYRMSVMLLCPSV
jgi:hypothetical protein